MTPTSSAATERKVSKLIVVSLLSVVAVSYLGAYFFLLFLKLAPTEASPLTMPRYAYYYWDNRDVRSRLVGAGSTRASDRGWYGAHCRIAETAEPAWRCPVGKSASHPTRRPDGRSGHHFGTLQESLSGVAGPNRVSSWPHRRALERGCLALYRIF